MNRNELTVAVAKETGCTVTQTRAVIDSMLAITAQHLADGDNVVLHEFGTFKVTSFDERAGVNPATGAAITIKAGKRVSFKASESLRGCVR